MGFTLKLMIPQEILKPRNINSSWFGLVSPYEKTGAAGEIQPRLTLKDNVMACDLSSRDNRQKKKGCRERATCIYYKDT